uniref:Uncharacterized protein n=1 Tax=Rhipicephalus zambeziensis TaxID=60191 RepID=A0A224Y4Z1_9ACAR
MSMDGTDFAPPLAPPPPVRTPMPPSTNLHLFTCAIAAETGTNTMPQQILPEVPPTKPFLSFCQSSEMIGTLARPSDGTRWRHQGVFRSYCESGISSRRSDETDIIGCPR